MQYLMFVMYKPFRLGRLHHIKIHITLIQTFLRLSLITFLVLCSVRSFSLYLLSIAIMLVVQLLRQNTNCDCFIIRSDVTWILIS